MPHRQMTWRHAGRTLLVTAMFNCMIAVLLVALDFKGKPFTTHLIMAQSIGLTIATMMMAACRITESHAQWIRAAACAVALTGGAAIGIVIGTALAGIRLDVLVGPDRFLLRLVFFSLLFGAIISYYFLSRAKMADAEAKIQAERIRRLTAEKQIAESDLRALEAQMEPHFLFNTLSNVISLLERDPVAGKTMLSDLIHYLRATVSGSRESESTIARELERINAYINIFKVRMGDRLAFRLDAPADCLDLPFPPAMIQPLVENAITHGIETVPGGGEIAITVSTTATALRVVVTDTGKGMHSSSGSGTSLANIRDRLHTLYGEAGRLMLTDNAPSGFQAIIEVPHAGH